MYIVQRDYAGGGPFPLRFTRTYNSLQPVSGIAPTELGADWRGFYDRSVTLLSGQSSPTARVVRPDGKSFLFTLTNGAWTPSPDVTARLESVEDASGNPIGWKYTTSRNTVETYDATGRLLSLANRNGLTQTLTYDAAGDLTAVTGAFGRTLTFTYNGNHELVQMTDPAGATYQYGYDGDGNLTSVTDPDGATRTYLYEDPAFPHALTGVIDANGVRFATWTYDSQGRAVESSLAGGARAVSLTFNGDGTTSVTDARGATGVHAFDTIFGDPKNAGVTVTCPGCTPMANHVTYDANGFVASRTDFNGNTTDYTYNARGLLVSRTDAVGTPQARTVTVTWSPVFRRPTEIRFPDRVIDFTYDAHGNRLTKTVTAGTATRTWTYQYNSLGLLAQIDGPRTQVADVVRLTYDVQGELASVTNALNQVWRITAYDPNGRPLSVVDPNGVVTQFAYDARGRRVRRTRAGRTTGYTYAANGELTQITRPNGMTRTFSYDAAHRLIAVTNNAGDRVVLTLDAAGDRVEREILDASGNVIHARANTFDPLGRLIKRVNDDQQMTQFTYDRDGNRLSITNPLGNTWTATYDALNRRASITNPAQGVTQFQYDLHNHLTQLTAPNGATTRYSYDGLGDLLSEASPDRGRVAFTYNRVGEPRTRTDARGITATFHYDALNRPIAIDYPAGSAQDADDAARVDVRLTYDTGPQCTFGIGRVCAVQIGHQTTRYGYDAFGNITRQAETTHGLSYTTHYAYDALNRLTAMIYPDGRTVDYTRDALDRIEAIQAAVDGRSTTLLSHVGYRPDGLLSSQTFGNGLTDTRGYDPVGRLIQQSIGSADTRVYRYDAIGDLVQLQTRLGVDDYTYDALRRLTAQKRASAPGITDWRYDPNGNRLSTSRGAATIPYRYAPMSNRLIQVGADRLTLNAAGDTIADHDGTRTFTYNAAGRLSGVYEHHHRIAQYRYNAFGLRTEKRTPEGTTLYHYDIWGQLLSETNPEGRVHRDYVWRNRVPVAQIDRAGYGEQAGRNERGDSDGPDRAHGPDRVSYLHTDGIGTVRLATDAHGAVVWRWGGGAFGSSPPTGGKLPDRPRDAEDMDHAVARPTVTINLRFPGQYYDRETGFFYNWVRYYNPKTGRYVSSDPIGLLGGVNTYGYVGANPLGGTDPM
ncbi:MAG TPA: RHS repeat-associated core domain-containing protein, partial [Gammaproteobacteria bacterium]|nr:RHS repeat-associated core domain-containing protein [Gammaproteobacteria bacterium]